MVLGIARRPGICLPGNGGPSRRLVDGSRHPRDPAKAASPILSADVRVHDAAGLGSVVGRGFHREPGVVRPYYSPRRRVIVGG